MLYHYCATETFLSILRHRSIWMSSLNLTNDSTEGKVMIRSILRYAALRGVYNGLERWLEQALGMINAGETFGFCLSEQSDLLSQWRGYADDGRGVSIGFRTGYLTDCANASLRQNMGADSFRLEGVIYDDEQQLEDGRDPFDRLHPLAMNALYRPQGETEDGAKARAETLERLKTE